MTSTAITAGRIISAANTRSPRSSPPYLIGGGVTSPSEGATPLTLVIDCCSAAFRASVRPLRAVEPLFGVLVLECDCLVVQVLDQIPDRCLALDVVLDGTHHVPVPFRKPQGLGDVSTARGRDLFG